MNHNCQSRGCGAHAVKSSECWCTRHRKILNSSARGRELREETEIARRGSQEWTAAIGAAQIVIMALDTDLARQIEMTFKPNEGGA